MQYAHALNFKSDHGQEHHVEEKKPEHTFNEDADKMVKSVKLAMENGEGCRVSISRPLFVHFTYSYMGCPFCGVVNKFMPSFLQVYGALDVQRVAGNFHISVHGLNIFVANQVILLKLQIL
jgi:thiol-disulfide isomerase/thioredoxin